MRFMVRCKTRKSDLPLKKVSLVAKVVAVHRFHPLVAWEVQAAERKPCLLKSTEERRKTVTIE